MTRCPHCLHEFHNVLLRTDCPECGQLLKSRPTSTVDEPRRREDEGFDAAGFAIGMATGIPLSPSHGVSTGALIGAALHTPHSHAAPAAEPEPSPAPDPAPASDPSPSYDSGSSSSDSGGGGGGGGE